MPRAPAGHTAECRHTGGGACTCGGSCVAPVPSPPQRLAALRAALAVEPEPLVALTHLLRLCRDEHRLLWERVNDPRCRPRVSAVLDPLWALPAAAELAPPVRRLLAAALEPVDDVPAVVVAHALAEFLDHHYGHTFPASFRRRSPYQPAIGDPVPLDNPDLRTITAMRPTSPPWRLAHRLDQTRRMRLAGDWANQFQVVFDYSLADTLTGLIGPHTVIATCHPNRSLTEFTLTGTADGRRFPVQPADIDQQRAEINHLLDAADRAGAAIVVLPELCITEPLAVEVHDRVRRHGGPRLLVAGSYHHQARTDDNGRRPRRRNTAIGWVRGHDQPLLHDKHSPGDRPIAEDIQPSGWPQLRIYVTADGWHLAIAICRDLLNPQAVNALTEAGANLILVPAMSETLVPFGGPAAHLVGSGQAIVAVANNPAEWSDPAAPVGAHPARALFGHPGFGQQTRFVHSPDAGPGLAVLTVGSAQLSWQAARTQPTGAVAHSDAPADPPGWLAALTDAATDPAAAHPLPVPLRCAAVLVLLSDAPTGPQVLLTERAADLTDYPGRLSFPGGRTEPDDDGPAATALREAAEEVGVDPSAVEVIGLLPPIALPDTGFLVTPVLAWTAKPAGTGGVNLAEVAAVHQIPLADLPARRRSGFRGTRPSRPAPDVAALGAMTATVLDQLRGILARADWPTSADGAERPAVASTQPADGKPVSEPTGDRGTS